MTSPTTIRPFAAAGLCLLVALVLLASTGVVVNANDNSDTCAIDCLHDTECVRGEANFTWHPAKADSGEPFDFNKEISRDGWHCACPPGLTGLRCGRKYESCNDGTHVCYNGGQCLATLEDIYQNEQQYCNCAATVNEDGNTVNYSGKYCEVELVHKNTRCTKDNNICQNGGTCKSVVDEIDPCDCPSGYVGRMCEFFEPSVPKCSLKCQHGGSCRYGTKTENHTLVLNEPNGPEEQNIQVLHQDFQYCECPSGFLGTLCETEDTLCGDIKCRHGSTCITIEDNGKTDYRCDCNEVNQKKLSNKEDVQFAGRHCEIKSTSVCHYDEDKSTFCTNNGTCPADHHEDCGCTSGFKGSHCQFEKKASSDTTPEESHTTCVLQCKNGGNCRKGSKNDAHVQDLLSKYSSELGNMGLNVSHSKNVEHCACPDGFVGLECEYSMTTCGDHGSAHPCFAGSECSIVNKVPTCVCEDADTAAAGIYCQHKPTDICDTSNKEVNGNRGFCTNGGICATDVNGIAVCRCHAQFEGPHCEYAKNATTTKALTSSADSGNSTSSGNSGIGGLGVALVVMLCATILAFGFVTYRRSRKSLIDHDVAPIYPDLGGSLALDDMSLRSAPVVDVGPEKDFDGNELRDVEFT